MLGLFILGFAAIVIGLINKFQEVGEDYMAWMTGIWGLLILLFVGIIFL